MAIRALRAVDEERKVFDITALTAPNNSGEFHVLNGLASGSSIAARIGNQCSCLSVLLRLHIVADPVVTSGVVRFILVIDKSPEGIATLPADLLQNITSGPLAMTSPLDIGVFKVVRVLRDWRVQYGLSQTTKVSSKFVRLNLKPRFFGLAGGIAGITSGALLLYMFSDQPAGGGPPQVELYSRLRFVG